MKLSGKNITLCLARRIVGLPGHSKSAYNRCVGGKLRGGHGGTAAFTTAAQSCKGVRGK